MTTEFFFVRHGETDTNRSGVLQGQHNAPLNANGVAQAEALAEYLRDFEFDVIYASDLLRASLTAEKIAGCGHKNIPFIRTPDLREMDCGDLEGKHWTELKEKYSDKVNVFYREVDTEFPNGESKKAFQQRVSDFLEKILEKHRGQKILLVSHGGVQQRIFYHIAGVVNESNLLPLAGNASLSTFLYSDNQNAWQLTSWNFREHLKNLPQHQTLVL